LILLDGVDNTPGRVQAAGFSVLSVFDVYDLVFVSNVANNPCIKERIKRGSNRGIRGEMETRKKGINREFAPKCRTLKKT